MIRNYRERKVKALVELVKINNSYAIKSKKFDPMTGEVIGYDIQAIGINELNTKKIALQKEIEEINAIIIDMGL